LPQFIKELIGVKLSTWFIFAAQKPQEFEVCIEKPHRLKIEYIYNEYFNA